ncbi:hypothetical protein V8J88_18480 [Massilia sp. W12]|uniref:hypothetical protein n=1 Tax=Massilia sp. W12 TaxID=3126507 RepID=UPI0030D5219B
MQSFQDQSLSSWKEELSSLVASAKTSEEIIARRVLENALSTNLDNPGALRTHLGKIQPTGGARDAIVAQAEFQSLADANAADAGLSLRSNQPTLMAGIRLTSHDFSLCKRNSSLPPLISIHPPSSWRPRRQRFPYRLFLLAPLFAPAGQFADHQFMRCAFAQY